MSCFWLVFLLGWGGSGRSSFASMSDLRDHQRLLIGSRSLVALLFAGLGTLVGRISFDISGRLSRVLYSLFAGPLGTVFLRHKLSSSCIPFKAQSDHTATGRNMCLTSLSIALAILSSLSKLTIR